MALLHLGLLHVLTIATATPGDSLSFLAQVDLCRNHGRPGTHRSASPVDIRPRFNGGGVLTFSVRVVSAGKFCIVFTRLANHYDPDRHQPEYQNVSDEADRYGPFPVGFVAKLHFVFAGRHKD